MNDSYRLMDRMCKDNARHRRDREQRGELADTRPLVNAAIDWWRGRCPVAWGQGAAGDRQHLENPVINTTSDSEAALARAVAAVVRQRQGGRR